MNKKELHNALLDKGIELPKYENITQKELQEIWDNLDKDESQSNDENNSDTSQQEPPVDNDDENNNSQPKNDPPKEENNISPLEFKNSFWCEELDKSIYQGTYYPKTFEEYIILKNYAK